jgi:TolB-like protein
LRRTFISLFMSLVALASLASNPPARAEERVRIALLPVVVHTSEGRDYLQKGMTDMLVSRLGRDPRLAVVPVQDASAATTDIEAARKVGLANDAEFVVFGSFTRFGEGASLDLSCASVRDAAREPRRIYVHASTMAALIPLLDGVADRTSFAVLGSASPGAGVAAGPAATPDANAVEVQEQQRRVESLEGAAPDLGTGSKPAPGTEPSEPGPPRRAPGLPSDRDVDRVR